MERCLFPHIHSSYTQQKMPTIIFFFAFLCVNRLCFHVSHLFLGFLILLVEDGIKSRSFYLVTLYLCGTYIYVHILSISVVLLICWMGVSRCLSRNHQPAHRIHAKAVPTNAREWHWLQNKSFCFDFIIYVILAYILSNLFVTNTRYFLRKILFE